MVQTPGFMILRRGIKPHNMSLASNKHINGPWDSLLDDLQIHFKNTQHSGEQLGPLVLWL